MLHVFSVGTDQPSTTEPVTNEGKVTHNQESLYDDETRGCLEARVRRCRARISEKMGPDVAPYSIFSTQDIKNLVQHRPISVEELQLLPGWGEAKVNKFGNQVVTVIREFMSDMSLPVESNMPKASNTPCGIPTHDDLSSHQASVYVLCKDDSVMTVDKTNKSVGSVHPPIPSKADLSAAPPSPSPPPQDISVARPSPPPSNTTSPTEKTPSLGSSSSACLPPPLTTRSNSTCNPYSVGAIHTAVSSSNTITTEKLQQQILQKRKISPLMGACVMLQFTTVIQTALSCRSVCVCNGWSLCNRT